MSSRPFDCFFHYYFLKILKLRSLIGDERKKRVDGSIVYGRVIVEVEVEER